MTSNKRFLFSINLINVLLLLVAIVFYSGAIYSVLLFMFFMPSGRTIIFGILQLLMVAIIATPPIFMCRRLVKNKNTNEDDKYLTIYILVNLICYSIPFIMYFVDLFGYLDSNACVIGLLCSGIGLLILSILALFGFVPKKCLKRHFFNFNNVVFTL